MDDTNMYDEDLDNPAAAPGGNEGEPPKGDAEPAGEPFLAPKSAFKGDLSPGTIHRVRVEASHDQELELVCVGEDKSSPAEEPAAAPDENSSLYE